jgi:transcriptional regulator with XRE-family HTH domain
MTPNRRLKQARELRGWSQAKVAEQIGTDATTVSRWERGLFFPTPYFRERLCALFSKNAEELGLLDAIRQPELELNGSFIQTPTALSSFHMKEEWAREDLHGGAVISLAPPSWQKRSDTFTYILHSAAHDQQAHMLWEDAYVRALRGQRAEAQRLGEASLNAFEGMGHQNANAVREWLNQRDLTSSPSSTANVPSIPLPMLSEQRKRPARRLVRRRGTGIVLILFLTMVVAIVGLSFSKLYTTFVASTSNGNLSGSSSSRISDQFSLSTGTGFGNKVIAISSATSVPTTTPVPTATPKPAASPTPKPVADFTARVNPQAFGPQNCATDSLGYRCTVLLYTLSSSNQGQYSWSLSSPDVFVTVASGTGTIGQQLQVIIYVQGSHGKTGSLVFILKDTSPVTVTIIASWQQ